MIGSHPISDFVNVNGIRLHTLDWGGSGPTLIFLTGMGCSAFAQFDRNVEQPFLSSIISGFQERFPPAKIIVIPDGHHYAFIAPEDLIYTPLGPHLPPAPAELRRGARAVPGNCAYLLYGKRNL